MFNPNLPQVPQALLQSASKLSKLESRGLLDVRVAFADLQIHD